MHRVHGRSLSFLLLLLVRTGVVIGTFPGPAMHQAPGGAHGGPGHPGPYGMPGHPGHPGHGSMMEVNQGVWMDISDKFIQRVTPQGTVYIPYQTPMSKPQFRRRLQDTGRHFILFPDVHEPKGSGHYILLRRWKEHGVMGEHGEPLYQAYKLHLVDSARSAVINWPKEGDGARGQRAHSHSHSEEKDEHHHHHKEKAGPEDFDVGDVVNVVHRKRRNDDDPMAVPPFSQISVDLENQNNGLRPFQDVRSPDFEGFSIEPEE